MNFQEKLFASFCKKDGKWGNPVKDSRSVSELTPIQLEEWDYFWKKYMEKSPNFENKIVVDYGCGYGFDSLIMLEASAKFVYSLEVENDKLQKSEETHKARGFTNVEYIDNTEIDKLSGKIGRACVDIIVCRDVMEHVPQPYAALNSMYEILKPGGCAYVGFSKIYKSPFGSHFSGLCPIPWAHLIFSEKTVLSVFKKLYGIPESANTYQDILGLNKLLYYNYLKMLKKFDWHIEKIYFNRFPNREYLSDFLKVFVKIIPFKSIKELFIMSSYVKLIKQK